ncbi:hypothetical protein ZWY2020_056696 [Hordeum vulgare]|nr:hypothetical protein ZWY2020_056696 [Hordeum vulgare]
MRRYNPQYRSPPRRGYGGRGRSPPRRGYGGWREQGSGSLLVCNIPLSCTPEDLRVPFERFGPVQDVYLPKDYYTREPRGFAFVEFVDPYDASDAQYHLNRTLFFGREITVFVAAESQKRPDDMCNRARVRALSFSFGHKGFLNGECRSRSRSYSPRYRGHPRSRSRSYSPAPRRRDDYSASPPRSHHTQSPRRLPKGHEEDDEAVATVSRSRSLRLPLASSRRPEGSPRCLAPSRH